VRQGRNGARDLSALRRLLPKCQTPNRERLCAAKSRPETQTRRPEQGKACGWVRFGVSPLLPGWVQALAGSPQSLGSRRGGKVSFDCPLTPGKGKNDGCWRTSQGPAGRKTAGLGSNPHKEGRDAAINLMEPKNRPRNELPLRKNQHH